MYPVVASIKKLIKKDHATTDNVVSKLHHKFTVILLVFFFVLVTSGQFLGNPIHCTVSGPPLDNSSKDLVQSYCWFHLQAARGTIIARRSYENIDSNFGDQMWVYPWFYVILLVQAVLFYLPR